MDKLQELVAELRNYAGPVEHGAMAITLHAWADRIAALRASSPGYDRELIARMLEARPSAYTFAARLEQVELLRAADNADAAGVHTAHQPSTPAIGEQGEVRMTDQGITTGLARPAGDGDQHVGACPAIVSAPLRQGRTGGDERLLATQQGRENWLLVSMERWPC